MLALPFFHPDRIRIATLAAQYRLPAMFHVRAFVEAGGLMAHGANLDDLYGVPPTTLIVS